MTNRAAFKGHKPQLWPVFMLAKNGQTEGSPAPSLSNSLSLQLRSEAWPGPCQIQSWFSSPLPLCLKEDVLESSGQMLSQHFMPDVQNTPSWIGCHTSSSAFPKCCSHLLTHSSPASEDQLLLWNSSWGLVRFIFCWHSPAPRC